MFSGKRKYFLLDFRITDKKYTFRGRGVGGPSLTDSLNVQIFSLLPRFELFSNPCPSFWVLWRISSSRGSLLETWWRRGERGPRGRQRLQGGRDSGLPGWCARTRWRRLAGIPGNWGAAPTLRLVSSGQEGQTYCYDCSFTYRYQGGE